MNKRNIPFSPPDITESEINEVIDVLKSGWITTGPKTKKFEKEIASYIGTNCAVCLNSATACMELTLRILGIGPGDEVITSAYTYTASAAVIHHVGARIVLVDTAPNSYEMDYDKLAAAITPRTKAVIAVDIGGRLCNYEKLFAVAAEKQALFAAANELQQRFNRITIIADSAHGFGASRKNLKSGLWADFTCFSFHAVKNLTTGEGGAVVWNPRLKLDDDELYQNYMLLSLHGQNKDALKKNQAGSWEYDIQCLGYKFNMPDTLAALGLGQLSRYETMLRRRQHIINCYDKTFEAYGLQPLRHYDEDNYSSGHLYLLRIPGITEERRNLYINRLGEYGIATNVHYKPLPMMSAYKELEFDIADYPNAYDQYCNEISLPLYSQLSDADLDWIISCGKKVFGGDN